MNNNNLFYSGNGRSIKMEDIISSISNLPTSPFEDLILGFMIFYDTNLYYDNKDNIVPDLFTGKNKLVFNKFIEQINSLNRNISYITKTDFIKTLKKDDSDLIDVIEQIHASTEFNLSETETHTPSVESFLRYLADLEYNLKERKTVQGVIGLIKTMSAPGRKQKETRKRELEITEQLEALEKIVYTKDLKHPILGNSELEEITKNFTDPTKIKKSIGTQFEELDKLGKIKPGELIILAARPSMGKTSFALNLYDHFLKTNVNSIFFSMEMSKEEMTRKLMDLVLKINTKDYLEDDVLKLPEEIMNKWLDYLKNEYKNLSLVDKPGISIQEIKKYIIERNYLGRIKAEKEYIKENNLDINSSIPEEIRNKNNVQVIFIDYLQIMNLKSSNPMKSEASIIGEVTTALKVMCLEHGLTIILISQLNRDSQKQTDKRPNMSQLKGSGSQEQDADAIWLIHREDYYLHKGVKVSSEVINALSGIAELIQDKKRGGQMGTVYLDWKGETQEFKSLGTKKVKVDGEVDENGNPIYIEVSVKDRIDEYKKNVILAEELNKNGYANIQQEKSNEVKNNVLNNLSSVLEKAKNQSSGGKVSW